MKLILVAVMFVFLNACFDSPEKDKKIDSLISENKHLKLDLTNAQIQAQLTSDKLNEVQQQQQHYNQKYAFVILGYFTTEWHPSQYLGGTEFPEYIDTLHYHSVSEIKEFDDFSPDVKYKFMDEEENDFRSIHKYEKVTVVTRKCLDFDSYTEASIELEHQKNINQ